MRFWLYIAQPVAVIIVLLGTLASIPALGQVLPTTIEVTAAGRTSSELVTAADGGILDLITYGGTASYTVRVTNTGTFRAYAVKLTGNAPTGPTPTADGGLTTTITAITPGSPTCTVSSATQTFNCNLGDLPDGQLGDGGFLATASTGASVTITLAAPATPYTTNCTLRDGGSLADNMLGDITVTASADNAPPVMKTFQNTRTRPLADLAVTITGPDGAKEGDTLTYQVHGQNNGPCVSNRPRLTNTIPTVLTFQSNSGACPSGFPCTLPDPWPVGASIDVSSTYTVGKLSTTVSNTGAVTNQVDLNSSNTTNPDAGAPLRFATPDPNPNNNTSGQQTWINLPSGGCNSVTGSTLGLFGIAVIVLTILRHRRRNT